jgi:hypothetical protein
MATSMLDFLNYDLSNTQLADAVKHARQTKANKVKFSTIFNNPLPTPTGWNYGSLMAFEADLHFNRTRGVRPHELPNGYNNIFEPY